MVRFHRAWLILLCVLAVALLDGCGGTEEGSGLDLNFSSLPRATARERHVSLQRIRLAWELRPDTRGDGPMRAEVLFINRYAAFAKRTKGTESAAEAARLWRQIARDHERRYPFR
jgi:hypothetical protein